MAGRRVLQAVLGVAFLALIAPPADAGDVTVFVTQPSPSNRWNRGYGAALGSTWFRVVTFEGEAARVPGETLDTGMTSFTVSALLAPPIGSLVPYGGIGYGVFRQTLGTASSDLGRVRALIVGVKLRLQDLIVLKAEYRRLELSGVPLVDMDSRVSFGAGIAF